MRGLLVFIALGWALNTAAAPPCGKYRDERAGAARLMVFTDPNIASTLEKGEVKSLHRYRLNGNRLSLRDLETGTISEYTIKPDGSYFESIGQNVFRERYVRDKPASCNSLDRPAVVSCPHGGQDEFACATVASDKGDVTTLQALCGRGLALACHQLADLRDREVGRSSSARERPSAECARAKSSEDKCGSLLSRSLLGQMSDVVRDSPQASMGKPLPKAYVEEQAHACRKIGAPNLCRRAAERAWDSAQYALANTLLDDMCQRQLGADACIASNGLKKLGAQFNDLQPARALPCGTFRSINALGLMREIEFGDRGAVSTGLSKMQARLVNGIVRVRHDKDNDFALRTIGTRWLLGLDSWHRYTVFEWQGGKTSCTPPTGEDESALHTNGN